MAKEFKKIMSPEFRVSYPNLFKPSAFSEEQEKKFNVQMLFPKENKAALKPLMDLVAEVIAAKWGDKASSMNIKKPWKDGDVDKIGKPEYEGMIYANATSKADRRPVVVDENCQPILDESELYGGCWCRAMLTCYAYDKVGNRGVSFGLQSLQKVRDDEHFGSAGGSASDFEPVAGGSKVSTEDMFN